MLLNKDMFGMALWRHGVVVSRAMTWVFWANTPFFCFSGAAGIVVVPQKCLKHDPVSWYYCIHPRSPVSSSVVTNPLMFLVKRVYWNCFFPQLRKHNCCYCSISIYSVCSSVSVWVALSAYHLFCVSFTDFWVCLCLGSSFSTLSVCPCVFGYFVGVFFFVCFCRGTSSFNSQM